MHVANLPGTQPISGTVALDAPSLAALETVSVANFPETQTVSGTVALDATALAAIAGAATPGTQPVSGPLTDAQLRASPVAVAVDGTVAVSGTVPVSAAALPLPTGAATEATLATVAGTIATTDAAAPASPVGQFVMGVRRDADSSPVSADGDVHPLAFNSTGRLKVSIAPADSVVTAGSITANAQTVAMDCARLSNISISMIGTSLVGHNATFEVSNNSTTGTDGTWYGVQVVRSNANTVEGTTGVLAATPVYMWQCNVGDYGWFRIRATAHTSGTAAYILSPSMMATEPIPASQVTGTQPVSGTVTADTELPAAAALADGAANATTPTAGAAQLFFNGTTWDRQRGNFNTTTGDTGAKTATGNGATQTNYNAVGATVVFNIGAVTGTTPTLVLKLQGSADGGTTWYDIPGASTASLTASGVTVLQLYPGLTPVANAALSAPLPRTWRVVWTIGGTTPSFTITNVQVAYQN